MTGLAFVCGIVVLFIGLLAYETEDGTSRLLKSQRGLWSWLSSDNWPMNNTTMPHTNASPVISARSW